jgi:quinoprotein glucose dehydrogenase
VTLELDKHAVFARALSFGIAVLGLVLGAGGARLLSLGGSAYYVVVGAALLASAVFLWRLSKWGARIYGALLAGTAVWAVWESGFDPWALAPRLTLFSVIGLLLLLPSTRRALAGGSRCFPCHAGARSKSQR